MVLGSVLGASIDAFQRASDRIGRLSMRELHSGAGEARGLFIRGSRRHRGTALGRRSPGTPTPSGASRSEIGEKSPSSGSGRARAGIRADRAPADVDSGRPRDADRPPISSLLNWTEARDYPFGNFGST
jgi:hypothetical protein